jgi:hypothetical protein
MLPAFPVDEFRQVLCDYTDKDDVARDLVVTRAHYVGLIEERTAAHLPRLARLRRRLVFGMTQRHELAVTKYKMERLAYWAQCSDKGPVVEDNEAAYRWADSHVRMLREAGIGSASV